MGIADASGNPVEQEIAFHRPLPGAARPCGAEGMAAGLAMSGTGPRCSGTYYALEYRIVNMNFELYPPSLSDHGLSIT